MIIHHTVVVCNNFINKLKSSFEEKKNQQLMAQIIKYKVAYSNWYFGKWKLQDEFKISP